jgi:hypothetical protein
VSASFFTRRRNARSERQNFSALLLRRSRRFRKSRSVFLARFDVAKDSANRISLQLRGDFVDLAFAR